MFQHNVDDHLTRTHPQAPRVTTLAKRLHYYGGARTISQIVFKTQKLNVVVREWVRTREKGENSRWFRRRRSQCRERKHTTTRGKGKKGGGEQNKIPPNSESTNQQVPANFSLIHSELRTWVLRERRVHSRAPRPLAGRRGRGNRERREWADARDGKEETLDGRLM